MKGKSKLIGFRGLTFSNPPADSTSFGQSTISEKVVPRFSSSSCSYNITEFYESYIGNHKLDSANTSCVSNEKEESALSSLSSPSSFPSNHLAEQNGLVNNNPVNQTLPTFGTDCFSTAEKQIGNSSLSSVSTNDPCNETEYFGTYTGNNGVTPFKSSSFFSEVPFLSDSLHCLASDGPILHLQHSLASSVSSTEAASNSNSVSLSRNIKLKKESVSLLDKSVDFRSGSISSSASSANPDSTGYGNSTQSGSDLNLVLENSVDEQDIDLCFETKFSTDAHGQTDSPRRADGITTCSNSVSEIGPTEAADEQDPFVTQSSHLIDFSDTDDSIESDGERSTLFHLARKRRACFSIKLAKATGKIKSETSNSTVIDEQHSISIRFPDFRRVDKESVYFNSSVSFWNNKWKNLVSVTSSLLPSNPKSFNGFLENKFSFGISDSLLDKIGPSSNIVTSQTRAFLAACFSPLPVCAEACKFVVGSCEGCLYPQFACVLQSRSSFECLICLPFQKWALKNGFDCSKIKSRLSTELQFKPNAVLKFSGLRQIYEHSISRIHNEAIGYIFGQKKVKQQKKAYKPLSNQPGTSTHQQANILSFISKKHLN